MASTEVFVNRNDEIERLTDRLATIDRHPGAERGGYLPKSVVNIYGAPGIGKSSLLYELKRRWVSDTRCLLFVGLHGKGLPKDATRQKIFFCERLLAQLSPTGPEAGALASLGARLKQIEPHEDERLDAFGDELVGLLQQHQAEQTLLLMVDACEQATDAFFAWLERRILLPLIHEPGEQLTRVLCLLTSQLLLRWRQHTVRRRVDVMVLTPLSAEATTQQVKELLNGSGKHAQSEPNEAMLSLGEQIYNLTFGHPLATRRALEYLMAEVPRETYSEWVRLSENQQHLSTQVVRQLQIYATQSMPGKELSTENWDILEALSILREFEVNVMRVVLSAYHEKYRETSQSMLLIYIRELLETRLAIWNSEVRAYQVAAPIRRIIAQRFALHQPELYQQLRIKAQEYYTKQIETVMSNRHIYIIEYFFQTLSAAPKPGFDAAKLKQKFEYLLERHYSLRDDSLKQLKRTLEQDQELNELLVQRGLEPTLFTDSIHEFQDSVKLTSGSPH
jgi:hypothetical protein